MTKLAILSGNTFQFRDRLKAYWTWDAARKVWTMPVEDTDTPESILRQYVRQLPGIRNRGDFAVTIEG